MDDAGIEGADVSDMDIEDGHEKVDDTVAENGRHSYEEVGHSEQSEVEVSYYTDDSDNIGEENEENQFVDGVEGENNTLSLSLYLILHLIQCAF